MKISLNELIEMDACQSGIERFITQTGATGDEKYDVASLVGGHNSYSDLLWLAGRKLSKERIVRFACDCALINVELIKPYCSDDDYALMTEFLREPTARAAADADADAAARAAADAAADADAADAAADADAAAVYAAAAAAAAVYATARAAADADADAAARAAADAAADAVYAADAAADAVYATARAAADAHQLLIEMFNEVE